MAGNFFSLSLSLPVLTTHVHTTLQRNPSGPVSTAVLRVIAKKFPAHTLEKVIRRRRDYTRTPFRVSEGAAALVRLAL